MKQENDNLFCRNSMTQSDKNISGLVKLAGDPEKCGKGFVGALINNALDELKQLKMAKKQEIMKVSRWKNTMGWAAMVAAACTAWFTIVLSTLLKINFFLQVVVILTMFFNWLAFLGARIL